MLRSSRVWAFCALALLSAFLVLFAQSVTPSGVFAPDTAMNAARDGASAAVLADGRILVTGGKDASGAPLISAEFLSSGASAGVMTMPRSGHISVALNDGTVLVAGGRTSGGAVTNAAEIYDPSTGSWTPIASTLEARAGATATVLKDGRVLIAGGEGSAGPLQTMQIFDPVTGQFSSAAPMSSPRKNHAAALLLDGRVAIAGGSNGTNALASVDIYDPATGSVSAGPAMATPREALSATTLMQGAVLLAGGGSATTEILNVAAGSITAGPSMSVARAGHSALLLPNNNTVLIVGGTTASNAAEFFVEWQNAFKPFGSLSSARSAVAAGASGQYGAARVAGGADSGGAVSAAVDAVRFPMAKTDKADYQPGDTATITGSGFGPNETVAMSIVESPDDGDGPHNPTATTDSTGAFSVQFPIDTADIDVHFTLTATGGASGLTAGTTFTDNKANSVNVAAPTSVSVHAGATAAYGDVTVGLNGVTGSCTVTLASTGLPVGASPVFGGVTNPFTVTTTADVIVHPFTVTTTAATTPGTYTFQVTATNGSDCQNPNTRTIPSNNLTLIVTAPLTTTTSINAPAITYGANGSVTVTVSATSTPTGNATLSVDGGTAVSKALSGGAATFTSSDIPALTLPGVPSHSLSASYAAQNGFAASSASSALTVNPKTLTASIVGNPSKPYDGNTSATLTPANFALTGLVAGQSFTVTKTSGTYDSKDVATAATVTASLAAGDFTPGAGTLASNYTLPTTASGAAHITAAAVTASITGNPTKPYDGNANATLTSSNFSLSGVVGSESFTVIKTSGAYNSKDVATAATVTASLAAGDFTPGAGTLASNYTLPTTASGPGHITAATVTASITGNPTKAYDANTNATLASANFSLAGLLAGESFTVTKTAGTYNSKDVATAATVTATLAAGDFTPGAGTLASNYTLPTTASGTGHITAATVTASIAGNPAKVYDGNTTATLAPANFSLSGLATGESFTVTKTSGTYDSKDVATAATVTASLAAGDFTPGAGTSASNYMLPTTASGAGHITAKSLTASIIGNPTKPYDGSTTATLAAANFSLSGLVASESFTVTKTSASYNTKDVATANTVTAALAAGDFTPGGGTLASNYAFPATASGAGQITALTVTAAIIGNPTKTYDGNTNATLIPANFSLTGLLAGESITVTKSTGTYDNKDAVTAATVTATLTAGDFAPVGSALLTNYTLPIVAAGAGHITAKPLTASIVGNPAKPYDGNANATLAPANFSLSGLVTGESITVTKTSGAYNSKDVASANAVTATLAGADFTAGAGTVLTNYMLPTTASGAGHITALTVAAAIIGNPAKVYDGNVNATLTSSNFSLSGLVGSESFTVIKTSGAYNSKDVATAATVTASLAAGDFTPGAGTLASNYTLPTTASGPGHITQAPVTPSVTASNKVYDGNTTATIASCTLAVVISPDAVTCSDSATFANPNVGSWTVTATGITLGGASAGNYTLTSNSATTTASITAAPTATVLSSSSNPSNFPLAITFTATVSNTSTGVIPVGTVTFMDGTTTLSTGNPLVAGMASFTTSGAVATALAVGSHSITAAYFPSPNFSPSAGPLSQVVNNVAPVVAINGPTTGLVAAVGASVTFTGSFTDTPGDSHTAKWTFSYVDPATGQTIYLPPLIGTVTEAAGGGGTVSASYAFTNDGVYNVKLDVTDFTGSTGTAVTNGGMPEFVVIYDPSAGFVTGGGWINSAAGSMPVSSFCSDCTALAGKASFGFNAQYKKGQSVPDGQTQFQFQVGNLNFHSTSYQWLVVSGPMAQFKGNGTINGSGNYAFILTAREGSLAGGDSPDGFRMKITDASGTTVVYDNLIGATSDSNTSSNTQPLDGGNIVIHSK